MADLPTRYGRPPSHDDISRALHSVRTGLSSELSSYTPANATDWTGTPPTTLAEALDRIAAALGPIA